MELTLRPKQWSCINFNFENLSSLGILTIEASKSLGSRFHRVFARKSKQKKTDGPKIKDQQLEGQQSGRIICFSK